jgi:hypothetical protein
LVIGEAPLLLTRCLVLVLLTTAFPAPSQTWLSDEAEAVIHYDSNDDLQDPVAVLQQRLKKRELKLKFEKNRGYLASLLNALQIPPSSQALVFSKTSSQADWTSGRTPRALYFNDQVYVGWAPHAPQLDLVSMDPKKGPIFYVLNQVPQELPAFSRPASCAACHQTGKTLFWPGLVARSLHTAGDGTPLSREVSFSLGHETPLSARWGGWYVTGTLGHLAEKGGHLGNIFTADPDHPSQPARSIGSDLGDLNSVVETTRYLAPSSDVVALLVFEHQARLHNLLTQANYEARLSLAHDVGQTEGPPPPGGTSSSPSSGLSAEAQYRIEQAAERLLDYMLFRHEAPLEGPAHCSNRFCADFTRGGPRDRRGRSLRELDLKNRLFRYPCSYLIYSPAFDDLAQVLRNYLWQRMAQILTGRDQTESYHTMSPSDRAAVLEILLDTKPEFKNFCHSG